MIIVTYEIVYESTPGGSRTPHLLIRIQTLYPVKLRALGGEGGI